MIVGIYKITNKLNGKVYIGQSKNIFSRFKQHVNFPDHFGEIDSCIQNIGVENFLFEVLETFDIYDKKILDEREGYYINLYNSRLNGYNCRNGNGRKQSSIKEAERRAITAKKKNDSIKNTHDLTNYMNIRIFSQEKAEIVKQLGLVNNHGRAAKWPTAKKHLIEWGYTIVDTGNKAINPHNGKRQRYVLIRKENEYCSY